MTHRNTDFILTTDALSAFESQLERIGLSAELLTEATSEPIEAETVTENHLSLAEERAWMLHQQDPLAASGPFSAALRLKGNLDLNRLKQAIKQLYQGDSNLNLVYRLDHEGELEKRHAAMDNLNIELVAVTNEQDAIRKLLDLQSQPLDLSAQASIKFVLMRLADNDVILGILGHHILLDDSAWKPIYFALSEYYRGNSPIQHTSKNRNHLYAHTPENPNSHSYWQTAFPAGLCRAEFPALFRHSKSLDESQQTSAKIRTLDSIPLLAEPVNVARYVTTITPENIYRLGDESGSSLFQTMVALFGLYLSSVLGESEINILIPTVKPRDVSQLNEIESSSNLIPVRVERNAGELATTIVKTRNRILEGLSHNVPIEQIISLTKTPRDSIPNILVTQFVDSSDYLTLDNIEVETVPIPPLRSDYDITLAFQPNKKGLLNIELTTGPLLSQTIGSFMLEQFVILIKTVNANVATQWDSFYHSQSVSQFNTNSHKDLYPTALNNSNSATTRQENSQTIEDKAQIKDADVANPLLANIILEEFKAILCLDEISPNDDFFDLGGHSLLATRVIGKLQSKHQLEVKIADFFNTPTANGLSQQAKPLKKIQASAPEENETQELIAPISLIQETYMEYAEFGRNPIFNIPYALRFSESIDEEAFEQALLDIFTRHHALRSLFVVNHNDSNEVTVLQKVIPMQKINDYRWFWSSSHQGEQNYQDILNQEAIYHFDLTKQLPIRVKFMRDEQGKHIVSILIYHLSFDEWSTAVFLEDLLHAYQFRVENQAPQWDSTPLQFHQFAQQQRESDFLEAHLEYWQQQLGVVKQDLPLFHSTTSDDQPSDEVDVAGSFIEFCLDEKQALHLNELAKENKASLFHVVYAALTLSLYYLGAGKKILVGTSIAGREDPRYQETIGLFTNVAMHYTHFNESMSVQELITQVKNNILESLPYTDVPFALIEAAVAAEKQNSAIDNLCETYIQLHPKNILNGSFQLANQHQVHFELLEPERSSAKFGLHFEVYEEPLSAREAIRTVINYRTSHYNSEQISLISDTCEHILSLFAGKNSPNISSLMEMRRKLSELTHH